MAVETIPALVDHAAGAYGDREALVDGTVRWSFSRLRVEIRRTGRAAIALGVRPGDRVAIWAPNSREWITAAFGLVSVGAVLVPLNTRYKAAEAADVLRRSDATALFTVRGFLDIDYAAMLAESGERLPGLRDIVLLDGEPAGDQLGWADTLALAEKVTEAEFDERAAAVRPSDLCDIVYTSGTTGRPKGVPATHGQTLRVFTEWSRVTTMQPGDRYLLVGPFFHIFGYKAGVLACLLNGVTMLPEPTFDIERAVQRIAAERVTVLMGPPTIFYALLGAVGERTATLRLAGTGAANVPVDLIHRIRTELEIPDVFTGYGLSESCGVVSVCPVDAEAETVAHTAGPALPGTQVRTVGLDGLPTPPGEPGEICVRGYNVMSGYLDDPEATAQAIDADGWLHTGDVGVLDERGYLTITDRIKDMFVVGGFNAYPAEIENVLAAHPGVADAAVIGVPDERLGEVGAAFIVPAGDTAELDLDELLAWLRERLANFKVPRHLHLVETLPRNASGKVVKPELRKLL